MRQRVMRSSEEAEGGGMGVMLRCGGSWLVRGTDGAVVVEGVHTTHVYLLL